MSISYFSTPEKRSFSLEMNSNLSVLLDQINFLAPFKKI